MLPNNDGYILATRATDGSPDQPIGSDEDAIMVFESVAAARSIRSGMGVSPGSLGIFKVTMNVVGEVVI
jgi:hypothetical protein